MDFKKQNLALHALALILGIVGFHPTAQSTLLTQGTSLEALNKTGEALDEAISADFEDSAESKQEIFNIATVLSEGTVAFWNPGIQINGVWHLIESTSPSSALQAALGFCQQQGFQSASEVSVSPDTNRPDMPSATLGASGKPLRIGNAFDPYASITCR